MTKKTADHASSLKPGKGDRKASPVPQNDRLTQQTRKQLGKHYANKYHTVRG